VAISPDDEDKPFVARWNALVGALLIDPSIKLAARTACDYGVMTGENVYPGNQRLARLTSYDERTIREAWHFLRAAGMAVRVEHGNWTGERRTADRYELAIPDGWRSFPMYGPHTSRFTCQHCGKLFNPRPVNTWAMHKTPKGETPAFDKDGQRDINWKLWKAAFCPDPRSGNGCKYYWERRHGAWKGGNPRNWEMYYAARGDDWPAVLPAAA